MDGERNKMHTLQAKSHEALLKLLNNIGIVGAALAAVADIIFVIIMVVGVNVQADIKSIIIFAVVNALVGLMINILLRYQGQKYAEVENKELCEKYYNKRARERKYLSMAKWTTIQAVKDFIIKGCTTAFSIFGVIYITINGSKNPIQLLLTLATLVLFVCFGLISMNSSYSRFYNIEIPHMKLEIEKREKKTEVKNSHDRKRRQNTKESPRTSVGEHGPDQGAKELQDDSGSGDQNNSSDAPAVSGESSD